MKIEPACPNIISKRIALRPLYYQAGHNSQRFQTREIKEVKDSAHVKG